MDDVWPNHLFEKIGLCAKKSPNAGSNSSVRRSRGPTSDRESRPGTEPTSALGEGQRVPMTSQLVVGHAAWIFLGIKYKAKNSVFCSRWTPRVIKIRWFITPRNTIALSTTKYHEPSYKPRGRGHTVNQDFRKPLENLLPSSNLTLPWKMFMVNRQTTNRIKMVCLGGCYVNIPEMKVSICLGNYCSLL